MGVKYCRISLHFKFDGVILAQKNTWKATYFACFKINYKYNIKLGGKMCTFSSLLMTEMRTKFADF